MKPALMRAPLISDIYNQKMTYESHLKKLDSIRQQRKTHLNNDHSRHNNIQQIKDTKSKSFAHKFNQTNYQINQSNLKFLAKLETVKPFTRCPSHSTYDRSFRDRQAFIKPITKRKIIQTERENSRIFFKMKSVSSNLSKDRMLSDYSKAEKIKSRITKYAFEDNKVALKSQKYFSHNKSLHSNHSVASSSSRKNNLATFYNKEDIIKNRIVKADLRQIRNTKGLPQIGKMQQKAFFTTEPLRQQQKGRRKW